MKSINNKRYILSFLVISTLSVTTNFAVFYKMGPRLEPDSAGYIRVAHNFLEYGTLLENDYTPGSMIPFTERMPGYPLFLAGIYKIFGKKQNSLAKIAIMQNILLTISALMIFFIGSYGFNFKVGFLAGVFSALDPWAKLIANMILPDSFYYMAVTLSILIGGYILKDKKNAKIKGMLVWGLSIGFASTIRPILNYYWLVLLPFFLYLYKIKKGFVYFVICVMGIAVFTGSWLYRNYEVAGFLGLQSADGISLLWSNHSLTRTSTAEEYSRNPRLARARDLIASSDNPMKLMTPIRKELGLSPYELNDIFRTIGKENIVENPFKYALIYLRNWIKILTTAFNVNRSVGLAEQFSPFIILMEKVSSFILFVIMPIIGFVVAKGFKGARNVLLFFGVTILFFLSLTAFVNGSFRYRLPIHGIMWCLTSITLLHYYQKLKSLIFNYTNLKRT